MIREALARSEDQNEEYSEGEADGDESTDREGEVGGESVEGDMAQSRTEG